MIASLAVLLSLAAFAMEQPSVLPPAPLGRLVEVGVGHKVHLYCIGVEGPTVMVVGGGFSFDWGLVQPEVARFTRICTYDPSGSVWSDPVPISDSPNCSQRVEELHSLLKTARIDGPYVLVGYSIGGLYARLYARTYPRDVSGMIIIDHAFLDAGSSAKPPDYSSRVDTPPVLISQTEIALGLEDDWNFKKLPQRDQQLHRWAMSLHLPRPTPAMAAECEGKVEGLPSGEAHPLGNMPVIVISTLNGSANYEKLQKHLLSLSRNSREIVAVNSSHMVIIDEPDVVIRAIRQVVDTLRR